MHAFLVLSIAVLAAACTSMNKSTVEERLLALEKNAPVRAAGLEVRTGRARIAGREIDAEFRWHHAGSPGPGRPTVVLVHGTPSSLVTWTEVIHGAGGLAETCDVYAPMVVGHGSTRTELDEYSFQACADWVGAFLDLVDLRDVTIVGNSYGGEFAWRCALDRPDRVSRVVLMSSSGLPRRDDEWLPEEVKMREMSLAKIGWLLNSRDRVRGALQPHFGSRVDDQRVEEVYLVCGNSDNWRCMIDLARDENGARSPELARMQQPVLLLWGERDVAYRPERFGKLFADTLPHARWQPVAGAGHYPQEEQPALVARAIADFAREARP